jgi:hypothetical protein
MCLARHGLPPFRREIIPDVRHPMCLGFELNEPPIKGLGI